MGVESVGICVIRYSTDYIKGYAIVIFREFSVLALTHIRIKSAKSRGITLLAPCRLSLRHCVEFLRGILLLLPMKGAPQVQRFGQVLMILLKGELSVIILFRWFI